VSCPRCPAPVVPLATLQPTEMPGEQGHELPRRREAARGQRRAATAPEYISESDAPIGCALSPSRRGWFSALRQRLFPLHADTAASLSCRHLLIRPNGCRDGVTQDRRVRGSSNADFHVRGGGSGFETIGIRGERKLWLASSSAVLRAEV
jgi:hypothetical protein